MTLEEYKKIISDAIKNEEEAYSFYRDVAKKTRDKNISDIFENLAKDELSHKVILQDYFKDTGKKLEFDSTADCARHRFRVAAARHRLRRRLLVVRRGVGRRGRERDHVPRRRSLP